MNAAKWSFLLCATVSAVICLCIYITSKVKRPVPQGWKFDCAECGDYPDELCTALFQGKAAALVLGAECEQIHRPEATGGRPVNCSRLLASHSYITETLSQEEADFPLAYILAVHKDLDTLEWLFRAIYTPQNIYCIHVDNKTSEGFRQGVQGLADCFHNVFLASRSEKVVYGGFSRLQADINCMEELVLSQVKWKYVINLCGQDYPLKTNRELVRFLRSRWKNKNITPGIVQPEHMRHRTSHVHREYISPGQSYVIKTQKRKAGGVPHGLKLYFGSAYYVLTREFVNFVLTDQRAKDLLQWSRDTYSPDEHYWVTLNRMADAPGADPNAEWEGNVRSIKWLDQAQVNHNGCKGHYVRSICVYGLGDLEWLAQKDSLFANKFEVNSHPLVAQCMERWLRPKTLSQSEVPIQQGWHIKNNKCFFDIENNDCSIPLM
ncbi:beta-1,3-galactosyl-O-glycosyl-glycoprotein beta-1,6-N-acetylglucosaminyltransferase 7-like isoform X1 [Carcharodon carcharias]|uniref:beta-1,3-galactosyl-O-glycosyl-glycoprotein beta-1,6-N-acetylglucosaminyltransferase 7-like isoform X1 n=1 Tax=Carcharodon carcharias TaxID=13397 RepID=UPI001B7F6CC5|nr:beta-1,3-galactosyl-O-glycosyl-glycoprotein beta-1,6-N-acetylglucosaminyltransferase 7-like isoform X1 [Carcharodon carcharias]